MSLSASTTTTTSPAHKPNLWISLEGNIGAGKSTLLKNIAQKYPYLITIPEPVEAFSSYTDSSGTQWDPLAEMYSNPTQNTVSTQHILMNINLEKYKRVGFIRKRAVFTDRHFDSCLNFIQLGKLKGDISAFAAALLRDVHRKLRRKLQRQRPDILVYLGTPPQVCFERIQQRQRASECQSKSAVNLKHLEALDCLLFEDVKNRIEMKLYDHVIWIPSEVCCKGPADVLSFLEDYLKARGIHFDQYQTAPDDLGMSPQLSVTAPHHRQKFDDQSLGPHCLVANSGYVLAINGIGLRKPFKYGTKTKDELIELAAKAAEYPPTECDM